MNESDPPFSYEIFDLERAERLVVSDRDVDRFAESYADVASRLRHKGFETYPKAVISASARKICARAAQLSEEVLRSGAQGTAKNLSTDRVVELTRLARFVSKGAFEAQLLPRIETYRSVFQKLSSLTFPHAWDGFALDQPFPEPLPEYQAYSPPVRELYAPIHRALPVVDLAEEASAVADFASAFALEIEGNATNVAGERVPKPRKNRLIRWIEACSDLSFLVERCTRINSSPYGRTSVLRATKNKKRHYFSLSNPLRPRAYYVALGEWFEKAQKISGEPSRFFALGKTNGKVVGVDFVRSAVIQFDERDVLDGSSFFERDELSFPRSCAASPSLRVVPAQQMSKDGLETIARLAVSETVDYYAFRTYLCVKDAAKHREDGKAPIMEALWKARGTGVREPSIQSVLRSLGDAKVRLVIDHLREGNVGA